jgi:hypothetical protein
MDTSGEALVRDALGAGGPQGKGRPGWPAGLAGMLVLVAAAGGGLARQEVMFTTVAAAAWQWGREHVPQAGCRPVVVFGDSMGKNGVLPSVLEARSGMKAWNLAVPSGVTPLYYFWFRRLIRAGSRPAAVLVNAETLDADPLYSPRLWERAAGLGEAAELAREGHDLTFLTGVVLARLFPSYRNRVEILSGARGLITGKGELGYRRILPVWRNWNKNDGAFVLPDWDDPPGGDPRTAQLEQAYYRPPAMKPNPVNHAYLIRFLDLAAENNVPVFLLLTPVHPEVQARRDRFGRDASAVDHARGLLGRYPGLTVVDGRHAGYPPETLADMTHLSLTGAVAFSDAVGGLLLRQGGPRWRELPPYDGAKAATLAAGSGAEDYTESAMWLYLPKGEGRTQGGTPEMARRTDAGTRAR